MLPIRYQSGPGEKFLSISNCYYGPFPVYTDVLIRISRAMKIGPYLHFHGNAEEAMNFYMDVFGAQLVGEIHRNKNLPAEYQKDPSTKDQIMHAFIKWDNNEIMFSDVPKDAVIHGTNNYISVTCDTETQVDNIYARLSEGAQKIQMELADTFWGSKFASLIDKFGVAWYLGWDRPKA